MTAEALLYYLINAFLSTRYTSIQSRSVADLLGHFTMVLAITDTRDSPKLNYKRTHDQYTLLYKIDQKYFHLKDYH